MQSIGRAIQILSRSGLPETSNNVVWGTVSSVDKSEKTCTISPLEEGADIEGVLLNADPAETGNIIYPADGSLIVALRIAEGVLCAVLFSKVDSVEINGNEFDGLVKVKELTDRLNALENAFNVHTHILALTSGTGTAAPPANQLTPTIQSDIENATVLHGKG